MKHEFRINSVIVGVLFIVTMLLGMADSYLVMPKLALPLGSLLQDRGTLIEGVFFVFLMAIGIVGIATTIFPVARRQNEAIAITYVSFRVIECLLLVFGAILYLFLLAPGVGDFFGISAGAVVPKLLSTMKLGAFQLSMVTLGIGSTLLNFSFFRSGIVPRWLSLWGILGYLCLLVSAVFSLLGVIDSSSGVGSLLYIPGGLWELLVFPIWLFIKGFRVPKGADSGRSIP
jgi:Domain of unknown function (DUF4386)